MESHDTITTRYSGSAMSINTCCITDLSIPLKHITSSCYCIYSIRFVDGQMKSHHTITTRYSGSAVSINTCRITDLTIPLKHIASCCHRIYCVRLVDGQVEGNHTIATCYSGSVVSINTCRITDLSIPLKHIASYCHSIYGKRLVDGQMEGSYTIATINCFTHIGMDTCFSIYRVIPEIRVTGFYGIGCTNDRLNLEGMGSSNLVVTTSLYHQGHSVGSNATFNRGIERSLSPIDRIYVCNRLIVFALIVSLDSIKCTSYIR